MKKLLIVLFLFTIISCTKVNTFENSERSYFMPNIDIYVIRGTDGFVTDGSNADSYILKSFADTEESVHPLKHQNMIAFHNSRIRIYYIKYTNPTIGNLVTETSFTLTDETGVPNKGTVNVDFETLRIFFYETDSVYPTAAGVAHVGNPNMASINYRKNMIVCIMSSGAGYSSIKQMSQVISHAMGHYFGLEHPFVSGGAPNQDSCVPAAQGTTNRVMDYVSNPEVFLPCERAIATHHVSLAFTKKVYDSSSSGDSIYVYKNMKNATSIFKGQWEGMKIIGNKVYIPDSNKAYRIAVD